MKVVCDDICKYAQGSNGCSHPHIDTLTDSMIQRGDEFTDRTQKFTGADIVCPLFKNKYSNDSCVNGGKEN